MKLPFKTRKQLKLEIAHLTEQLRIQSEERKKENARSNKEISDLEMQVNNLNTEMSAAHRQTAEDAQTIADLRAALVEKEGMISGLSSSVVELKEKAKKHLSRIKTLEEKVKAAKQHKPTKDPFAA